MSIGMGILWALMFSVPFALLSAIRVDSDNGGTAAAWNFGVDLVVLFVLNAIVFYRYMPAFSFPGLIGLVLVNLLIVAVVATCVDWLVFEERGNASVGAWALLLIFCVGWTIGRNSGHDSKKAANIVNVEVMDKTALPASSTDHLVVVSADIAELKASQAMSTGVAGDRNYNTYLNLGPATLQFVGDKMMYVFPLYYDGSGNKHKLEKVQNGELMQPGYIMVNAEDPNASATEHFDGEFSMKVCVDCGQSEELSRWVYQHGYRNTFGEAMLEVNDQGHPFWTMTIDKPHLGWTFNAPSSVLLVNAHTGDITEYAVDKAPDWVDRVYSKQHATDIANWHGEYANADFKGWWFIDRGNAGRLKVSGDPVLVYTGDGHPDWRILLTSHNEDAAVSKIVLMDAHDGSMRVYTPQESMGIEDSVLTAFRNASGQGASNVRANRYQPVDLTLHVIYGHLTWMAIYQTEGNRPTFQGVGFVDAYHASSNNVATGTNRATALANYRTQLATQPNANGNNPQEGEAVETATGTIRAISWDISNSQKLWYILLEEDLTHVYVGLSSNIGPAIVVAQPGDPVTITFQNVGEDESTRTMQSFTDDNVPLTKPGG